MNFRRVLILILTRSLLVVAVSRPEDGNERKASIEDYKQSLGNSRVVGGSAASLGQFPWQASVLIDSAAFCGGSLISTTAVLTAAHCVLAGSLFTVTVGSLQPRQSTEASSQAVNTTDAVSHEDFYTPDDNAAYYDVGVIRWQEPVQLTDAVATIRLPTRSQQEETFSGQRAVVSGWGMTNDDATDLAATLQYADVNIIDNDQCRQVYGDLVDENAICILGNSGQHACFGDSGGPLVVTEADGLPTVVGVVSWGSELGCETSEPDVLMRVTAFLDWIADNAGLTVES